MSNPDITIPVRLRPDHLAAIKAALARAEALERELNGLISNAVFEADPEPRPVADEYKLAVVVDGAAVHSITLATDAERTAYCAGFVRAAHLKPGHWLLVTPVTFDAHEFDADTAAQVRAALSG